MRRSNRWSERMRWALRDEEGSAALEFVFGGLLLLVPIVYLVIALGAIQSQSLGVESGARHIARAVATASGPDDADARAAGVVDTVVAEYGLDADSVDVTVSCADGGRTCPAAGETLMVTVHASVRLPLVPPVLGLDELATVDVEASAVQKVSRFWGER